MAVLPQHFPDRENLRFEWFPSLWQCFIYRNWEMLSPARLALVLNSDEETVCRAAAEMGLSPNTADEALWLKRGYVTLIRANWHLLTYPQLCTLLDWDEDYLAYMLHNDDFLEVKLGEGKPDVPPLAVTPLSAEQERQTAAIARVTRELAERLGAPALAPFDFSSVMPKTGEYPPLVGPSRFDADFLSPYSALYGDTFLEEELIESSFPDDILSAYAALGVGGILCQAVLYSLVPCPYAPELSVGHEKRIRGLNKVIERLGKYGLKLYLYLNEPRDLPDSAFIDRPDLKGDVEVEGYASLCLSTKEAQDFFRESMRRLTASAPGLGGYTVITASENHTNCYSHRRKGETTCPRCRDKSPADLYALVISLIEEGVHSVDPDIPVVAANWPWQYFMERKDEEEVVKRLPSSVAVSTVSEWRSSRTYEDKEILVEDYSISIPGPSDASLAYMKMVRSFGNKYAAKIQLGNSWELSTVPFIPAYGHFYRLIRDLVEKAAPEIVQTTWTMGSFPSPVFRMFAEMTRKDAPIPEYRDLMARLYPNADTEKLLTALAALDDAFDHFPFSVYSMYNGPQHMGPALPLWREPTGWKSCMVGPIYDDMRMAAIDFGDPYGVFYRQYEKLVLAWEAAHALLLSAYEGRELTMADRMLLDCSEGALLHFTSALNHLTYIKNREEDDRQEALVREEEVLAIREAELMGRNPTIGYEASNHYFFTRTDLFEKVLNCRYLLGELR